MIHAETVSIIVPVYKVEAYLAPCVDSLLRQTYQNIEVILVDDGSPDRCGEMCDAYAEKDSRVKVIHQKNSGQSVARNKGVQMACGEYITFVDSDDVLQEDCVTYLMDLIKCGNAKMAICGVALFHDGATPVFQRQREQNTIETTTVLSMYFYQDRLHPGPTGKLIHRSICCGNEFPPGIHYAEDIMAIYRFMKRTDAIAWGDAEKYGYRINQKSQTGGDFSPQEMESISILKEIHRDVMEQSPVLIPAVRCRIFSAAFHIFFRASGEAYEGETAAVWEQIVCDRRAVLLDHNARKKARAAALLSYLGQGAMRKLGAYLLARENRKLFKEQR